MSRILILAPLALLALGGCRTAADIVTFPVKAVGQGVDWATTSQDEADRNYGREVRKREEEEGRAARERDKAERKRMEEEAENAELARRRADRDRERASTPY